MKKIALSVIIVMSLFGVLSSCNDNKIKNVSEPVKGSSTFVSNQIKQEVPVEKKKEISNRKQEYKDKLADIEKELKSCQEAKDAESGTTSEMQNYVNKQWNSWAKAESEICRVLNEQQVSTDAMDKLDAEEIQWIKESDEKAKKAGSKFEGGTFFGVAYGGSLARSTRERCYELVERM